MESTSNGRLPERLGPHGATDGGYLPLPVEPTPRGDRSAINIAAELQTRLFADLVHNPPKMSFGNVGEWASWSNRLLASLVRPSLALPRQFD